MKASGRHLLAEYSSCNTNILNDINFIEKLMGDAAIAAKATIVASVFHPFSPQGVSGVVVVEESHLSIHTWPELGYAAVDFFTCGECLPERAHEVLRSGLQAANAELMLVNRGMWPNTPSMQIVKHHAIRGEQTAIFPSSGPKGEPLDILNSELQRPVLTAVAR